MKVILYFRVSTARQGESGLGLEGQRFAVDAYCTANGCKVLGEYTEVESGKRDDRPELAKALNHARLTGATVVIAKLDRLSRNAAFLLSLRDSGAKFVAADIPNANDLTIGILALVAQEEREAISKRTREALAAAKRRGVKLGNPNGAAALRRAGTGSAAGVVAVKRRADEHAGRLRPVIEKLRAEGLVTLGALAEALNRDGMAPRGGRWHSSSVRNLLARLDRAG
jgi:DNA invertase Pin-like site-specific DNA recombinase